VSLSLESLVQLMMCIDTAATEADDDDEKHAQVVDDQVRAKLFRYCRLNLHMIFLIGSRNNDLNDLILMGLLNTRERVWLEKVDLSARHDMLCGWIDRALYQAKLHDKCSNFVHTGEQKWILLIDVVVIS
jgi:hypothetical protein